MLQRLSEDLEYYDLLDKAAKCQSSLEQMCYVAAFTVSSYSTTVHRTGKPFNPLLGETFELDRLKDCGYRSLCEQVSRPSFHKLNSKNLVSPSPPGTSCQVSHHPPAAAHHAFSEKGWSLRQEITLASKFRGKYLSIMPLGECVETRLLIGVWLLQHSLPSVFNSGSIQCLFDKSNNHYSWKKVTTTIHNIIVGKLWIDQVSVGHIEILHHSTSVP